MLTFGEIGPQGVALISRARPATVEKGIIKLHDMRVELLALRSGRRDALTGAKRPGPARQSGLGDVGSRYVAWRETTSTDLYQDPWVLFGHDRREDMTYRLTARTW